MDLFSVREARGRKQVKTPPTREIVLSKIETFAINHPGEGRLSISAQIETHSWGLPVRFVVFVNGGLYYTNTVPTPEFAKTVLAATMDGHADALEDLLNAPTLVTLARRIVEAQEAEEMRQSQVGMFT